MKTKVILWLSVYCLLPLTAGAQKTLSSTEMIGISPIISKYMELPADAHNSLANKLGQIVTQNGFGSVSGQFVLTCNLVTLDKQATATAPPNFIVKQQVSLYVLDATEGVVIDEMSIEVQGVNRLENKAYIQGINQISPQSTKVKAFMKTAREKIIDYYTTRIPTLITKAQALADREQYEEALAVLAAIPEAVDEYPMIADRMNAIYKQLIEKESAKALQNAKSKVAVRDYYGAVDDLQFVDPSSEAAKEVPAVQAQIETGAGKQFEWEQTYAMRELEVIENIYVESAKAEQMRLSEGVNAWYRGRFVITN